MKARIEVRLKSEVLDPQGDAVRRALGRLGFDGVTGVRIGKLVEIELLDGDANGLKAKLDKMADDLLANPVTEDYQVHIV